MKWGCLNFRLIHSNLEFAWLLPWEVYQSAKAVARGRKLLPCVLYRVVSVFNWQIILTALFAWEISSNFVQLMFCFWYWTLVLFLFLLFQSLTFQEFTSDSHFLLLSHLNHWSFPSLLISLRLVLQSDLYRHSTFWLASLKLLNLSELSIDTRPTQFLNDPLFSLDIRSRLIVFRSVIWHWGLLSFASVGSQPIVFLIRQILDGLHLSHDWVFQVICWGWQSIGLTGYFCYEGFLSAVRNSLFCFRTHLS